MTDRATADHKRRSPCCADEARRYLASEGAAEAVTSYRANAGSYFNIPCGPKTVPDAMTDRATADPLRDLRKDAAKARRYYNVEKPDRWWLGFAEGIEAALAALPSGDSHGNAPLDVALLERAVETAVLTPVSLGEDADNAMDEVTWLTAAIAREYARLASQPTTSPSGDVATADPAPNFVDASEVGRDAIDVRIGAATAPHRHSPVHGGENEKLHTHADTAPSSGSAPEEPRHEHFWLRPLDAAVDDPTTDFEAEPLGPWGCHCGAIYDDSLSRPSSGSDTTT